MLLLGSSKDWGCHLMVMVEDEKLFSAPFQVHTISASIFWGKPLYTPICNYWTTILVLVFQCTACQCGLWERLFSFGLCLLPQSQAHGRVRVRLQPRQVPRVSASIFSEADWTVTTSHQTPTASFSAASWPLSPPSMWRDPHKEGVMQHQKHWSPPKPARNSHQPPQPTRCFPKSGFCHVSFLCSYSRTHTNKTGMCWHTLSVSHPRKVGCVHLGKKKCNQNNLEKQCLTCYNTKECLAIN